MKPFLFILFMGIACYSSGQDRDTLKIYYENFEFNKVIDHVTQMKDDADTEMLNLKALSLKKLNKHEQAASVYEKIYTQDTSNTRYLIELANCHYMTDNFKEAALMYQKALLIRPGNPYLYKQLGETFFENDDFTKAIQYYHFVYKIDSSHYIARQLARSYENLERVDTAIYYYEKTLAIKPKDFFSSYTMANLLRKKKEYDEAAAVTISYLAYDSLKYKMWQLNGLINFLNKKYDASIQAFENCLALGDTSTTTAKHLGYCYFKTKKYKLAKDYLQRTFEEDTTNIDVCYLLGLSCSRSIYKKLGIDYLNKALELTIPKPSFLSQLYQDLASAQTAHYKYNEALFSYTEALKLTPGDTLLIFKIASHYDNWLDNKEKALVYYQHFLLTKPRDEKPAMEKRANITVSYYDYAERRIQELNEDLFWHEKKPENKSKENKTELIDNPAID